MEANPLSAGPGFQPWTWLESNKMYASFGLWIGYSSNDYTYMFDTVITLDFLGRGEEFAAFAKWLNEEFEEAGTEGPWEQGNKSVGT